MKRDASVAYFSMEIALVNELPNYAGGLGVLAADTLLAAADLDRPVVGISLFYHQHDDPTRALSAAHFLTRRPETVSVEIEGRSVKVAIWEKELIGRGGASRSILFLSTYLPENAPWDRDLTKALYAPDRYTRLGQELVLGVGGVRALAALGFDQLKTYHLNEGHAALATLELLRRENYDDARVRSLVTFTTHTPIAAGHDYFEYELAHQVLGPLLPWHIKALAGESQLGLTELALNLSRRANAVSRRHQAVCQAMFPGRAISNVTNGIYLPRWAGEHLGDLLSRYLPGWEERPEILAAAPERLPLGALGEAKRREEAELVQWINFNKGFFVVNNVAPDDYLTTGRLTIGFARRFVPYKRPDLLFRNLEQLAALGDQKLQLIFASRCHPSDSYGQSLRTKLGEYAERLRGRVRIVLVPDYDLTIAKRLVAGVDLWLNTPVPPNEASGTSGMKAALNGGLNLSARDGWWLEGLERAPQAGWAFGQAAGGGDDESDHAELLQGLTAAVRCYYDRPLEWSERMRDAISLASFFNTSRLVAEYEQDIWS